MGRRSDHSRDDLRELIVSTGHALMAEVGYARFSAREVAKRIGYSVGTVYNVFGSNDALVAAINTLTFVRWTEHLRTSLAEAGEDRIRALVAGYFDFARANPQLWMAIYDHRLPDGMNLPPEDVAVRGELTGIVVAEIATALDRDAAEGITALARSLIATVHGHCSLTLTGSFALMGESHPFEAALMRVREALATAGSH